MRPGVEHVARSRPPSNARLGGECVRLISILRSITVPAKELLPGLCEQPSEVLRQARGGPGVNLPTSLLRGAPSWVCFIPSESAPVRVYSIVLDLPPFVVESEAVRRVLERQ